MSFDRDQTDPDFKGVTIHPPMVDDDHVPLYVRSWCKEHCPTHGSCGWVKKKCPYYTSPQWMKEKPVKETVK